MISEIDTRKTQAQQEVIELLEKALADARADGWTWVGILGESPEHFDTKWSRVLDAPTTIGRLEMLKFSMLVEHATQ